MTSDHPCFKTSFGWLLHGLSTGVPLYCYYYYYYKTCNRCINKHCVLLLTTAWFLNGRVTHSRFHKYDKEQKKMKRGNLVISDCRVLSIRQKLLRVIKYPVFSFRVFDVILKLEFLIDSEYCIFIMTYNDRIRRKKKKNKEKKKVDVLIYM